MLSKQLAEIKISSINGILLNGILIPILLHNTLASWFLMNLDFFLQQIAQLDKSIYLFCLVLLTIEFSFAVFFFQLTQ